MLKVWIVESNVWSVVHQGKVLAAAGIAVEFTCITKSTGPDKALSIHCEETVVLNVVKSNISIARIHHFESLPCPAIWQVRWDRVFPTWSAVSWNDS